jgi:hypothetical protein
MHCRACNYALWNLAARHCPECGTGFKPSEFEFTPGSVRYLCPVCSKAYYGTSPAGHLVPRSFSCVQCGTAIDMDEMVLTPAHGVSEDITRPIELPWLARDRRSPLVAALRTCLWALGRPTDVGRSLPGTGVLGRAWRFLILTQSAFWGAQIGAIVLLPLLVGGGATALGFALGWAIAILVFVGVTACIVVPLWGFLAHVILRGTGPTRAGTDLTLSTICFAGGANLPTIIPFVGYFLGPLWWIISAIVALRESQRVTLWRAALAILPVPIVTVGLIVAGYIGLVAWGVGMAGKAMAMRGMPGGAIVTASSPDEHAAAIHSTLCVLSAGTGRPAVDPLRAVVDGRIPLDYLLHPASKTAPETWYISGVPLQQLPFLTRDEHNLLTNRLAALPPSPAGALRLGDAVILTSPMTLYDGSTPGVWTVIVWPDPTLNPTEDPSWTIYVADSDGTAASFSMSEFDAALQTQNVVRQGLGLPAIPHPRTVK